MVSKCVHVVRGDGVVVEAAVEGPKKAAAYAGIARWHRRQPPRRRAGPPRKRSPTALNVPLRTAGDKHRIVGGP